MVGNIHDYASKFKDIPFSEAGFNDFDGMVLTQFSSFHMNRIGMEDATSISVCEAAKKLLEIESSDSKFLNNNQEKLLTELANSSRYKDVILSDFFEINIPRNDSQGRVMEQSGAITCSFRDPSTGKMQRYLAFKATDGTLEGWEEDLQMSYQYGTQCQRRSKDYLEKIAEKYDGDLILGGHSKGGNSAMYAYLECDASVSNRVTGMKLYDPPGFHTDIRKKARYADMIKTIDGSIYAPYDCVIGISLSNLSNVKFVDTNEVILFDHDFYTWKIDLDTWKFVSKPRSNGSKMIDILFGEIVFLLPEREKAFIVKSFFDLIQASGFKNIDELIEGKTDSLAKLFVNLFVSNLPIEEKLELGGFILIFFPDILATAAGIGIDIFSDWLSKKIDELAETIREKAKNIYEWTQEKIAEFSAFLDDVQKGAKALASRIWEFITSPSGNKNADFLTEIGRIEINTYSLHMYSGRLRDVNRRLAYIDSRLDTLYGRVGLKDLLQLIQTDLQVGFSGKLLRCSEYLDITANEFDRIESKLIQS